jgi:hypothetical protein
LEREVIADGDVDFDHELFELVSDIVSGFEMAVVEEVFVAPVDVHVFSFVLMEGVHDSDVVAFGVDEFGVGILSFG